MHFFESFSSKCLEGTDFLYTFALAFENKPLGKFLRATKERVL